MSDLQSPHASQGPVARSSFARPAFHDFNGRRLFGLHIVPAGPPTGAVLYLPPFAEEMNRCRSTASATARALAARGLHVLLLDPLGTGESEGEVTDGDWDAWCADAAAAASWLAAHTGHAPMLWGMRTGALLAGELARLPDLGSAPVLLWQPVLDGKLFLNQYLRLRIASQMVHDGERETTESIRAQLARGEPVEVAGYPLTGRLADALAARRLDGCIDGLAARRVHWIEVVGKAEQPLAPPSRKLVEALQARGGVVRPATVVCPLLWQLQDRADTQALVDQTVALLAPEFEAAGAAAADGVQR